VVTNHDAGLILNHMRGTPESWAKLPPMKDAVGGVRADLEACVHRATRAGLDRTRIVIDPGIGFGKRGEQNSEILARLPALTALDVPILVGPSRKQFLKQATEKETLFATAAAVTAAILAGAHMVRVHDVTEMRAVVNVADAIARHLA
jgi:dihydropteroate synthase